MACIIAPYDGGSWPVLGPAMGRHMDDAASSAWMMLPPLHCQILGAPCMMWDEWTPTVSYPLITRRSSPLAYFFAEAATR